MIARIKKYTYIGLLISVFGLFPYIAGWRAIFGINLEIEPININTYILYGVIALGCINAWWTINLARYYDFGEDEAIEEESYEVGQVIGDRVAYDSGTALSELKKVTNTREEWLRLVKKYSSEEYKGEGWKQVKLFCLNRARTSGNSELKGKTIELSI